ncbi:MAG: sulfurtransferase [Gammaproteobacteria bacterium]|nr:sulfurtransferase [Gammaproteobacteria bacterium]MCH2350108.1 rhodanese-like domain-containing protein [Pseudomonadales bacterium]HAO53983.1 rhodanese-like domain-containing protein [Gammaproteobacteria bacterium]
MDQLFEFIGNHPWLVGAFAVVIVLFIRNEVSRGGKSVSAQELVNMVNKDGAVVIDVRDEKEFREGHIVNAINIPHVNFSNRIRELEIYKQKPLVVACKMGQHSGSIGTQLRKAGFSDVARLQGGVTEWRNQNLPVLKSK